MEKYIYMSLLNGDEELLCNNDCKTSSTVIHSNSKAETVFYYVFIFFTRLPFFPKEEP